MLNNVIKYFENLTSYLNSWVYSLFQDRSVYYSLYTVDIY